MTETLLALVPSYGVWLVAGSVLLSCLALPIPSSMLVMAAGGFAASGDLTLWQVIAAAFVGFALGDQISYGAARHLVTGRITKLRATGKLSSSFDKAEALLTSKGWLAVLLSRTVLSPFGPYIGYLCGALKFSWMTYSAAAVIGAALWAGAYAGIGYVFADQISQIASLISDALGGVAAICIAVGIVWYIRQSWRKHQAQLHSSSEP